MGSYCEVFCLRVYLLSLCLLVSSADDLQTVWTQIRPCKTLNKLFDTLMMFKKSFFFEKDGLKKNQQKLMVKKHKKNPPSRQRVDPCVSRGAC